jgi:hypothetical protein
VHVCPAAARYGAQAARRRRAVHENRLHRRAHRTAQPPHTKPGAGNQLVECPRNDIPSWGRTPPLIHNHTRRPERSFGLRLRHSFFPGCLQNRTEYLTKLRTMFLTGELNRPIRRPHSVCESPGVWVRLARAWPKPHYAAPAGLVGVGAGASIDPMGLPSQ